MTPRISIVVTTYNREELLKETISSILLQTFGDFELIVVDNYSNYDFQKVMENFNDKRIKSFQNANNGIIAINRNYGIKRAVGEYIALCDDDDLWEPEKLQEQINVMAMHQSILLVCTDISFINLKEIKSPSRAFLSSLKNFFLSLNIVHAKYLQIFLPYITNSSVLFRRGLVDLIGYINEDPDLKAIEDYEYWFRAAQSGKVFYLNKKLVRYRLHLEQISLSDTNVFHRTLKVVKGHWDNLDLFQKFIYLTKNYLVK